MDISTNDINPICDYIKFRDDKLYLIKGIFKRSGMK